MAGPASASSYPGFPSLSSDQQKLLLAALTSNDRNRNLNMDEFLASTQNGHTGQNGQNGLQDLSNGARPLQQQQQQQQQQKQQSESIDPSVFDAVPRNLSSQPTFAEGLLPEAVNGQSDFDVDVDLGNNDYDGDDSFGNYDTSFDGEFGEKRKSPEDDEDDEEGDSKRREGDDKGPRKPGRKPLTSEPTTKRKAQNRAAQRAFRERKEKHLKDLEIKVSSLEQASESANHENELLRAQISKLQSELHDYRKRLSIGPTSMNTSPPPASTYRSNNRGSSGPYDFQFDFPSFGTDLFASGLSSNSPSNAFNNNANVGDVPAVKQESTSSRTNSAEASPNGNYNSGSPSPNGSFANRRSQSTVISSTTASLFNVNDSSYGFPTFGSPSALQQSVSPPAQSAARSNSAQAQSASGSATSNARSPSNSSASHNGAASSTGTSPEPSNGYTNGDSNKPKENGVANGFASFPEVPSQQSNVDLSNFQFDPTLFGGYRETQDAIFGDGDFTGGLYEDYLNLQDFEGNPFNFNSNSGNTARNTPARNTPMAHLTPKPTLMDQLDRHQEESHDDAPIHTSDKMDQQNLMTAHKIWEQLSTCPKFTEGELDIDGLCSELSKKATCSEKGAVIPKAEWEAALWRLVGHEKPDGNAPPMASTT